MRAGVINNRFNFIKLNESCCNKGENIRFKAPSCVNKEAALGDMANTDSVLKARCDITGTPISGSFEQ